MSPISAQPIPQELTPPPALGPGAALFLDFDGTLAPLAQRPDNVRVHPAMPALLEATARRLGGALAIITGRRLAEVDQQLAPFRFGGAGLHGAELRRTAGAQARLQFHAATRPLVDALRLRFGGDPRLLIEDKTVCVALHYRGAPERALECRDAMHELTPRPEFEIVNGHMVVEARPRGAGKGRALRTLLGHAPFLGRLPVFVGDDVTDEDGFAAAAALGGYGVKVGHGPTVARYRFGRPDDVFGWLQSSLHAGHGGR